LVYHLIVGVIGIALLLCGWVWVQERANRGGGEGATDEALCAMGGDCPGCTRAVNAKLDSASGDDKRVCFESSDRQELRS